MTKKLEELFDLPEATNLADEIELKDSVRIAEEQQEQRQQIQTLDNALDKIDAALPSVKDINTSDSELDELAALATENFTELMSLGMNVEPRFGAEIFSTASSLLGHAITAKNAKIDKKLKVVQLQIQKARLDLQKKKMEDDFGDTPEEGHAQELDRNVLLAQILDQNKKDK